jgi:hypothetical protein
MQTGMNISSRRMLPSSLAIILFIILGTLLVTAAYFAFSRAYDHAFFLDLVNNGISAVEISGIPTFDLKAQAMAEVFHAITAPARLFGDNELLDILWLRIITLVGVILGFEWVLQIAELELNSQEHAKARNRFLLLFLLYPGQIAWSASLLRDAPSCALFFTGLYSWTRKQRLIGLGFLSASLALRPEFLIVLGIIFFSIYFARKLRVRNNKRKYWLFGVIVAISIGSYQLRAAASEFSQLAFEDTGASYPVVEHPLDIPGYLNVFLQGVLDPIPLHDLGAATPFYILEFAFFTWLLIYAYRRLPLVNARTAGLLIGTFISLWIFAYFEIYVSGFARHRMGLMVILIAVVALPLTTRPKSNINQQKELLGDNPLIPRKQ